MQHRPYPQLQVECVTTLIDITRRGALRAEIKEAAKCAYDLGGAALGIIVGEPDDVIVGDAVTIVGDLQLNDVSLQDLETRHAQLEASLPELESFGAGADAGGFGEDAEGVEELAKIDPATVALFFQLALKVIEFFMNRKKS